MAKNPVPESADEADVRPAMLGGEGAPIITFELVGATRASGGLHTIALVTSKVIPLNNGGAQGLAICAAYLKGTEEAMLSLRKAIDDVLLLGQKTEGQAN